MLPIDRRTVSLQSPEHLAAAQELSMPLTSRQRDPSGKQLMLLTFEVHYPSPIGMIYVSVGVYRLACCMANLTEAYRRLLLCMALIWTSYLV